MRYRPVHLMLFFFLFLNILFIDSFLLPAFASNYIYDENNRLIIVSEENVRTFYRYDEVGNLLSIETENNIPQSLPPVINSINHEVFITGLKYQIIINGQNLLSTTFISSDNPHINISNISAIDSIITATLSIDRAASNGTSTIMVSTLYGTASININLYTYNIIPQNIALFPSASNNLSVTLVPPAPIDFNGVVYNKTRNIISVPPSVFIPAGGVGNLTVNTLKSGTGLISLGTKEAEIYVFDPGTVINTMPFTVYIDTLHSQTPDSIVTSNPFTVYFEQAAMPVIDATSVTLPVTVSFEQSSITDAVSVAPQFTVSIEQLPAVTDAVIVGMPVTVSITD